MNFFDNIFDCNDSFNYSVCGLNKELNAIYIYNSFIKNKRNIIVLANSIYEANDLYGRLLCYTSKVLLFPMDDFIASEAIAISPDFIVERLITLNNLIDNQKYIIVTNLMGILRYLPSKDVYKSSIIELSKNTIIDREKFIIKLINCGYERVSIVSKSGEFAVRGFVIDIFPIDFDKPIRIEFWGDNIDDIRYFDLESQLSNETINSVKIYPFTEFLGVNSDVNDEYRKQKYLPNFSNNCTGLWNYVDNPILFYYDYNQIISGYNILFDTICDYDKEINDDIKTNYMWNISDINVNDVIYLMEFNNLLSKRNVKNYNYVSYSIDNFEGDFEKIKNFINKNLLQKKTIILCIENKDVVKRIVNYLEFDDIIFTKENEIIQNKINIINKYLNSGFIYDNFVVISTNDLFGKKDNKKKMKSKFRIGTKINNIDGLKKGDYIVHIDHGIGIYSELCVLNKNGLKKDYIKLIYAGGDILYLPVEKIDKITKFSGNEGSSMKLDSLSGDSWIRKKMRVRNKLASIAEDLMKISIERESSKGFAFSSDDEEQILFESKFEYNLTPDQEKSILLIKEAMQKEKPMDMLLCGDVGYGKTEVAFRAMFKAVNDGKQVAYLCPTTILSSQQFNNALDRFKDFPINIALLNRFTSYSKQNEIIDGLRKGKIDILFGTHKILNDKISFRDLGLLVVDEEQRFGVVHKEKIKKYKANVDVLTLSATPIPRTLQMSISGIRGLALIETPPEKRRPIQTYVIAQNNNVVKDAIYKELSRKGQIFILYNKIDKLDYMANEIAKLVPEASIRYAHGGMNKDDIENVMNDFINYKFDILLCTTIIETGIDIPNVNTIIIYDADHFGLSQLYQIRGRIGRSDRVGYAYLMYNNRKELNDMAVKRLNAIKEFTELGSGFKIAMRDLSIRGAGDILGSEQSGFIDSVGIDLYLKILQEEVNKLKGIEVKEESDDRMPIIEVNTHISDDYVSEEDLKIKIHKMINDINSLSDIKKLKNILKDRFGNITEEMVIYMHEEWLEKQAKELGIINSNQKKNYVEVVLPTYISQKINGEELFYMAYDVSKYFRLSYKNKEIHIILDTNNLDKHFVYYLNELLDKIISNLKK